LVDVEELAGLDDAAALPKEPWTWERVWRGTKDTTARIMTVLLGEDGGGRGEWK
jgi:hypothetical protein